MSVSDGGDSDGEDCGDGDGELKMCITVLVW